MIMIKLAILTMDDLRAHYFIVTILRSCGEDSGGNQLKKSLVFHSLAPEKNETGERLMMMTMLMMMIMMMMSKFMMMMMLMMMTMILQVRNLWRGSKTCWN